MRRALLISSQILDLRGTDNDAEAMRTLLTRHDFKRITTCTGAKASRDGILAAYRTLISETQQDDAVVVYYSGHGGYAEDRTGHRVQYILPTDWKEDENSFNGIIDTELSHLMAQLTEKSSNVTVILDCCHSSLLSRGGLISRAVPGRWTKGLEAHVESSPPRKYITENPNAVRFVAAEADREAYEAEQDVDGQRRHRGLFTRALQRVLEEPESSVLSWRAVCNRVREMVLERAGLQQVSVEGPMDRTIFTTSEQPRPDAVVYFEHKGKPALRASRLLGADIGIEYDVVRRGQTIVSDSSRVATATITAFDGAAALVSISPVNDAEKPQAGSLAFPKKSLFPRVRTALVGNDEKLRDALSASSFIDLVDGDHTPRFVVDVGAQQLVLTDQTNGPPYSIDLPNDAQRRSVAVQWIERWARAEALRAMPGGAPSHALELTWGCAIEGELIVRGTGDRFRVGEKICVHARNTSSMPLYMWVIDIGVSGKVTIVSVARQGQTIQPGARLMIGEDKGRPEGLELEWPDDLPSKVGPRRETIVVIAANYWTDVSVFETPTLTFRSKGQPNTILEDTLRALGAGTSRDLRAQRVDQMHWVACVHFDLVP